MEYIYKVVRTYDSGSYSNEQMVDLEKAFNAGFEFVSRSQYVPKGGYIEYIVRKRKVGE